MSDLSLGDRMKTYEAQFCDSRLDVHLPVIARVDGRAFSTFTRGMEKPFCESMSIAMNTVCKTLVDKTHARIGYVQSDEISLVYLAENVEGSIFFDGRVQKLTSVLASFAAAAMARAIVAWDEYADLLPHFDCRVMQLPSKAEAANMILWRWKDARKNAISGLAQAHYSPKRLHGLHGGDMLDLLAADGISFDALPSAYRNGTFWRRDAEMRELTDDELTRIPEKHRPSGPVMRTAMKSFHVENMLAMTAEDREALIFSRVTP
jgi:tRNA(His) 5'-end guanylyltransferase